MQVEKAREHLNKAKKMIEEMGYGRRTPEVMLLSAQIAFAEGHTDEARTHLAEAKATFEKMGIKMWDHEVKKLEEQL